MYRLATVLGFGLVATMFLVSAGTSGEGKKDKVKGQLPAGWKDLKGLSDAQKVKIRAIDADARMKIQDLDMKMKEVRSKARAEQFKVLTEEQKEAARKLATGEETKKDDKK